MFKKHYILAIVSFLSIPVISIAGVMLFNAINPEIAAGHSDYERNYRLLQQAKNLFLLATLLATVGLWLLTCFFLLKSRGQSNGWLPLAILGTFGFIVLTMLGDKAPAHRDLYQQFVRKLKIHLRVAYELCLFMAVWVIAFQTMVLKRDLMIAHQAAVTGRSIAQIIDEQNASSGMWAFSEGLEILYLVVLFYLLWPICFNLVGRLPKYRASSRNP
ncbi:MAG: hypothetical protein NTY05_01920 [Rhodocyclales bacterium]|nr:hypothetical protein [Rhodocyclales bacterium]